MRHGFTFTIAGAVAELAAAVLAAGVAAPRGEAAVAPPVRPWPAGST